MRDVELYRRPPVLTGDEPAVLRHARGYRRKRRWVQAGFVAGVGAIAALVGLSPSLTPFFGILDFAALSSAFVVLHLAVGKRVWMKPVEVYEDGIVGSQITALFCRRRFVPWKDVESLELTAGGSPPVVQARFRGDQTLESAPGELGATEFAKMEALMAKAKEEAAAARALFESLGKERVKHG